MATPLNVGLDFIINQKVGGVNTPLYPFTKTTNVKDATGKTIDEIVAGLAAKEHGNHVPDFAGETLSNLRFLRNDNTWANIQAASTTQAGVVQLSSATDLDDETVAATAKAVKAVKDAVDAVAGATDNVKKSQLGVATSGDVVGVATLDENGLVPAAQLPSYVDDVVEVNMGDDKASATDKDGGAITPETSKIYVDLTTNKTYRWSGSIYVEISESLALGETSATAFDGARGLVAYNHSLADHARVDATKTEASEINGYIKINGADVHVYTHPSVDGATETNPHGTTAADLGLDKVENKSAADIIGEITKENLETAFGGQIQSATSVATSTQSGVMSASQAAKLENCTQTAVSTTDPSFSDGIWFQIVSSEA